MAKPSQTSVPGHGPPASSSPAGRTVTATWLAVDALQARQRTDLPFLRAMSRMGVTFSVFCALLVAASFPFLRTATERVVDLLAAVMVVLLFLVSTVGVRIANRIANRLLAPPMESATRMQPAGHTAAPSRRSHLPHI